MSQTTDRPTSYQRGSCWGPDGRYYPSELKQTMPLSDLAVRLIGYLFMALNRIFAPVDDCYVGADQFFFWDPLDSGKRIAPDVYVLFGVTKRPLRSIWRTWEHGAPSFVVEISSPKSRRRDRGSKLRIYQDILKVPEYLIYDEETEELLLYRLHEGRYREVSPDSNGRLASQGLGVSFGKDAELGLRIYSAAGAPVPWMGELWQENEQLRDSVAALMQMMRMELGKALEERDQAALSERKAAAERRRLAELERKNEELTSEVARLRQALEDRGDTE